MRNDSEQRQRDYETSLSAPFPSAEAVIAEMAERIEDLGAELAVAAHLLHQWNEQHRADPEDWAAAARLRGTVQETAKFLGAEFEVAA